MVNVEQLKQVISAVEEGFKTQMNYITMRTNYAQHFPQLVNPTNPHKLTYIREDAPILTPN